MILNALVSDPGEAASIMKSRAEPSRAEPSRAEPSRAEPSRAEPSRAEPSRAEPSRAEPSRAEPSRAEPSRAEPSRAEPSRAEPSPSLCPPGRVVPRLSGCRPGRPPDSLPPAPLGAQSDPLPTDSPGDAPPSRRREPASGDRHRSRGRAGRSPTACICSAAALLLPASVAIRDAAPAGARPHPASGGCDVTRQARPGLRRPVFAGVLALVLLGFAALLAVPQAVHAPVPSRSSISSTMTTAPQPRRRRQPCSVSKPHSVGNQQLEVLVQTPTGQSQNSSQPTATSDNRWLSAMTNDNASGGTLKLSITGPGTGSTDIFDTAAFRARLTLHLGTDSFDGADATESGSTLLTWTNSGLTWADHAGNTRCA